MTAGVASRAELGRTVARALSGAWRVPPPSLDVAEADLRAVEPLLLGAGAAGLAWARLRHAPLAAAFAGGPLQQAYRYQALAASVREARISEVVEALRQAGVESLVGKGWAVVRLYSEAGMRPCGDIDVYVRRCDHARARAALSGDAGSLVDLHGGLAELDDREEEDVFARSVLVGERGAIRVFGAEDHLRLVALHAVRHGLLRSLWLCDVAVALEAMDGTFDWDRFLDGRRARTAWAVAALEVARCVLGAHGSGLPAAARRDLPPWVVPAVLREWGTGRAAHGARTPMAELARDARAVVKGLILRWPNGIEASAALGIGCGDTPRLPLQVAECLRRTALFLGQAGRGIDDRPGQA